MSPEAFMEKSVAEPTWIPAGLGGARATAAARSAEQMARQSELLSADTRARFWESVSESWPIKMISGIQQGAAWANQGLREGYQEMFFGIGAAKKKVEPMPVILVNPQDVSTGDGSTLMERSRMYR